MLNHAFEDISELNKKHHPNYDSEIFYGGIVGKVLIVGVGRMQG